jgi:hypothetical protein
MDVVSSCASAASAQGPLTALTPGFSLVDVLAPLMRSSIVRSAGTEEEEALDEFARGRMNGDRIRVFLTDPKLFRYPGDFKSHAFLNDFEVRKQIYGRRHPMWIPPYVMSLLPTLSPFLTS